MFITDGRPNIKHMDIPNDMAVEATEIAAKRLHESNIHDLFILLVLKDLNQLAKF